MSLRGEASLDGLSHGAWQHAQCSQGSWENFEFPAAKGTRNNDLDNVRAWFDDRALERSGQLGAGVNPDRRDAHALTDVYEVKVRIGKIQL
jgi:hypothetical protein